MKVFCIALVVLAALALGDAKNIPSFKSARLIRSLISPFAVTTAKRSAGFNSLASFKSLFRRSAVLAPKLNKRELSGSEEAVLGLAMVDEALGEDKRHVARKANKRQSEASKEAEALIGLAALEEALEEETRRAARKASKRQTDSEDAEAVLGLAALEEALGEKKRHVARKANKRQSESDEEALAEMAVLDALTDSQKRRSIVNSAIKKRKAKPSTSEEEAEALLGLAALEELGGEKKRNAGHKASLKVVRKAVKNWFPRM